MSHNSRFSSAKSAICGGAVAASALDWSILDPLPEPVPPARPNKTAAVLIALTEDPAGTEVLYTRRSDDLASHRGQVSFPGGRWDSMDGAPARTALRESEEEVGLDPNQVELKGCVTSRTSINGLDVLPFVGVIPAGLEFRPSPQEIADIFKVPLRYFCENSPSHLDVLARSEGGQRVLMPAWNYQGFDIWGLTAIFTRDLLMRMGIEIPLDGLDVRNRG